MHRQTVQSNGYPLRHDLTPVHVRIDQLKPLGQQTRRHAKSQIGKLAASLREFGFVLPIVVDAKRRVVSGWALVAAAQQLGLGEVPVVTLHDLSEAQLRMLRLALNRLVEDATWDMPALRVELTELLALEPDIDLQLTGFSIGQIDVLLSDTDDLEDALPPREVGPAVSKPGDLWLLDQHRLICADARQAESYGRLMQDERARMTFADPPYNVAIDGHASGNGRTRHPDFAMASGEMSAAEFEAFLAEFCARACEHAVDGSLHFICMDWRGIGQLLNATRLIYDEQLNLCVWNKPRAGMGSFYRSKHELVFVFKKGRAPHLNNVQLGRNGRNRCNVWDYQNSWTGSPKSKLALHPTVKPVALIADAIRDGTNEHDIVLDPFGGAGTTLIAAERTRRRARLIELEPGYVDVTIRRWQHLTGKVAVHAGTGEPFGQTSAANMEQTHGQEIG
ncbi:ParB N-terminal domain-containing protein [Bradyrhizobium sp. 197]|uniref:site-specific DNA-methyltransferase n=1 Tax=Bradyrhizobium sp. 197 TaxID=2782663 RepID=UPI001FFA385F|nr:DNA methyltransferase [Bradyrhizobium sp. 197]MCK1473590.1 ParB N-terminal domain-containing protein [Bradyrhizobium sp. 197]